MQVPIWLGAPYSETSPSRRRSSRAWPPTDKGRPATPSTSDVSESNPGHKCCLNCCHRAHDGDCSRNKKKRQSNNQGQRPPAPSPAFSASSGTKVATPLPHLHHLHSISSYPVIASYPPDPIHSYLHPAHAQAAPSPQQPAEIPREAPQAMCTCQQPVTPENESRNYYYCCRTGEYRSEYSADFDDVASEGSTEAVAGFEYENPSVAYYHPLYLAVPVGTATME